MRLIAFGCSLTFGYALPDTGDTWTKRPSDYAWPTKLAEHLKIKEVVNLGNPGASNKKILFAIQNFKFQKNDIIFVLWSHKERWCVIEEPYNAHKNYTEHFAPHINNKKSNFYYKEIYNDHDHLIDFYTRTNYAKMMLDLKGITNYHLTVKPYYKEMHLEWNSVNFLNTCLENDIRRSKETFNDYARDNQHPGLLANQKFADMIYQEVRKNNK